MSYKTNITKEFKSKGFVDGDTFISSAKQNAGEEFNIQDIFDTIGRDGVEIDFSIKVKDVLDTVEEG